MLKLIKLYDEIGEKYRKLYNDDVYTQKVLYIIYLQNKKDNINDIEKNINLLERKLSEYKKDDEISKARKLIQKGFKDFLDKEHVPKN